MLCGGDNSFRRVKFNDERKVVTIDSFPGLGLLVADGIVTDLALNPSGINDNGQVVGSFGLSQRVPPSREMFTLDHPGIWENGVRTQLGAFSGGENGQALAINNAGTVVGWAVDRPPVLKTAIPGLQFADFAPRIPSMWRRVDDQWQISKLDGVPEELQAIAINEREQVLVRGFNGFSTSSFLWEAGVLTELPTLGGDWTAARDINDAGQVVGQTTNGQTVVDPINDPAATSHISV